MLTFDFRDFERAASRMSAMADQIPFALARSMNDAAKTAREEIIGSTWTSHVQVRNQRFLSVALKRQFASKRNLRVEIFDNLGRASLMLHEGGGSKTSKQGNLAIPTRRVGAKRTGRGVPKGLRPKVLPNSFVTDGRRPNLHLKQGAIYQREGAYRAAGTVITRTGKKRTKIADFRTVKLMYVLRPSAPFKGTVPFHADFNRVMTRQVWRSFGPRLRAAMAGRRSRG